MGRIKSLMVKKAARQLIGTKSEYFTESFEHNKKILGSNNMPSKPIRNKVAGYLARLVKMRKIGKRPQKVEVQEKESEYYPHYR